MGQYISVYMDDEDDNYKNQGLYEVIAFIGKKSYDGEKHLYLEEAYKRGKKIVNSKLKKWHLTTIEKLVIADSKMFNYNYTRVTDRPVWKIHRRKAKKVFDVIYSLLIKYNNLETLNLFETICKKYGFHDGAEAAGEPYYEVIKDETLLICQNYNEEDINILTKCAQSIQKFSKIY